jgi:hypothetical protein
VVELLDGDPPLLDKPFEDGIGHPQGRAGDMGKIPLPEGSVPPQGIVDVFEDDKFGVNRSVRGSIGHKGGKGKKSFPAPVRI